MKKLVLCKLFTSGEYTGAIANNRSDFTISDLLPEPSGKTDDGYFFTKR
jgi:hypothetical protein